MPQAQMRTKASGIRVLQVGGPQWPEVSDVEGIPPSCTELFLIISVCQQTSQVRQSEPFAHQAKPSTILAVRLNLPSPWP